MTLSLVVAVTDGDWFEHLSRGAPWPEVNFWAPSARAFRALRPGELFLFKLKAPVDRIVGGGVFAHAAEMPASLAWEAFGEGNGAPSLMAMRRRIARYRRDGTRGDFPIGARVVVEPTFWPEADWLAPPSWAANTVSFKTYRTDTPEGLALWEAAVERMARSAVPAAGLAAGVAATGSSLAGAARTGRPQLVTPRLGQGAFRSVITMQYDRRCAVTGERTLPALDAAHIRPWAEGGGHEPRNGLLLRRDVHSLFDAGYVTVTPQGRFEVSDRIREEFSNGKQYYALHGSALRPPAERSAHPDPSALRWHNEEVFLG